MQYRNSQKAYYFRSIAEKTQTGNKYRYLRTSKTLDVKVESGMLESCKVN